MKTFVSNTRKALCLLLLLFSVIAWGQNAPFTSTVSAPSPGTGSLSEQGNIPVNLYTGSAQVGIPLFNIRANHLSIPISLSYNSQGIKVEQQSSNVGLNWSLNAGGVIARSVNDLPDDCYQMAKDGLSANNVGYYYNGNEIYYYGQIGTNYTAIQNDLWRGVKDTEPDIFVFNFNGVAGKFVFDKDGEIRLFSKQDIKIIPYFSTTLSPADEFTALGFTTPYKGAIERFEIITADGVKYRFGKREATFSTQRAGGSKETYGICDLPIQEPDFVFDKNEGAIGYYSAWYLDEIINPFGNKEMEFVYEKEVMTNLGLSQVNDNLYSVSDDATCFPYEAPSPYQNYLYALYVNNYALESVVITERLKAINYGYSNAGQKYGTVAFGFAANPREDVLLLDNLPSGYDHPRALKTVTWKDENDMPIKAYELSHSLYAHNIPTVCSETINECRDPEFTCQNCPEPCPYQEDTPLPDWKQRLYKRLKLDQLVERGWDDDGVLLENPPLTLEYDPTVLPFRLSAHQDFWGYFTGGQGAATLLPTVYAYPTDNANNEKYQSIYSVFPRSSSGEIAINRANRNTNEGGMQAGALTKIQYPTGGFAEIVYEANRFDLDGQAFLGGGLRVQQISTSDGNGNAITRSYTYEQDGTSTGRLINFPQFATYKGCLSACDPLFDQDIIAYTAVYSSGQTPMGTSYGTEVAYAKVIENQGSTGRVEHIYNLTAYAGVSETEEGFKRPGILVWPTQDFCQHSSFPFPISPNYDWNNGLLLETHAYNAQGELVSKNKNIYQLFDVTSIPYFRHYTLKFAEEDGSNTQWRSAIGKTKFLSSDKRLVKTIASYYGEQGGELVTEMNYEYDPNAAHRFPVAIWTTNSDGKVYRTEYVYPTEAAGETSAEMEALADLVEDYRIAVPVRTFEKVDGVIRKAHKLIYKTTPSLGTNGTVYITNPEKVYHYGKTDWILTRSEIQYTLDGFIKSVQAPGFNPSYYEWNKGLLMERKQNLNGANGTWTTSYGYNRARILNRVTDPNDQTVSYEYDGLLRQKKVFTKNGAVTTTKTYTIGGNAGNQITNHINFGDSQVNTTQTQTSIETFDGLGRPLSITAVAHTPSVSDAVLSTVAYDDQGRAYAASDLQTGSTITSYDGSPLSRIKSVGFSSPGTIDYEYLVNDTPIAGFAIGTLFKTVVKDANGNPTTSYKDKIGRTITTIDAEGGATTYEYDDYGLVTKMIPPGATSANDKLYYEYHYDDRLRLYKKKIPGAKEIEYVYNERDEIVLVRDGELKKEGKWLCTVYDDFSRPVSVGFYVGDANPNAQPAPPYLTENTYDIGVGATVGKLTQTIARVLNPDESLGTQLYTVYQYDGYGRLINTIGDNHLGGQNANSVSYDIADKIWNSYQSHTSSLGNANISNEYYYDHAGRSTWMTYAINGEKKQMISYGYNAKDQMIEQNIHWGADWQVTVENEGVGGNILPPPILQSIDYGYNQRGWLTNINSLNPYASAQNGIASCTTEPTADCFDTPITTPKAKCDEKCGGRQVAIEDFLKIRVTNEDINLNCFTPCECEKETPLPSQPDCDPKSLREQSLAFGEVVMQMPNVTPASVSYPTELYRLKLCDGKEMHVLKEELPKISGGYDALQRIDVGDANQTFKVEDESGAVSMNTFGEVLQLRQVKEIRLDGYQPPSTGNSTCDLRDQILAQTVAGTTLFSSYYNDSPYADLTTVYPGADQSLYDNGAFWHIGTFDRGNGEVEWNMAYDFGTYTGLNVTSYAINLEVSSFQIQTNTNATIKLALYDGTSFIPVNGGNVIYEVGHWANNLNTQTFTLIPDQIPSPQQISNMRLVLMSSYGIVQCNIELVNGTISFTADCAEECDSTLPSCNPSEVAAQKASLVNLRAQMQNTTVEHITFPTKIYRLQLCDGSEMNIFEHELQILQGNYTILDETELDSSGETVLVSNGDPDQNDLFRLSINYFSDNAELNAQGQKNGNIASLQWQVANQAIKGYGFQYDKINRLKRASYAEYFYDLKNGVCEATNNGHYDVYGNDNDKIRYDERGNIINLKRNGVLGGCAGDAYQYGIIDDLTYAYLANSNELEVVDDNGELTKGFRTNAVVKATFQYDDNGNMIHDPHKKITVVYNYLNLPSSISSDQGTIQFWYDTQGNKLKMEVVDAGGTTTRDYVGIVEYVNGVQDAIYHENGRAFTSNNELLYQYFLQDHLGNARVSFIDLNNNGIIEVGAEAGDYTELTQEDHYYPFGMKMEGPWAPIISTKNRYQYNGIEYEEVWDLNVNFATYRTLDPSLGRWWGVDVEAEAFHPLSPYSSMGNNPINNVDPQGDFFTGFELMANTAGVLVNAISGAYKNNGGQMVSDFLTGVINGVIAEANPLDWNMGGNFLSAGISVTYQGGTDGIGLGIEAGVSLGFKKARFVQAYTGVSLYSSNYGTNTFGGHLYAGAGIGFGKERGENKVDGFWLRSTFFADFTGETTQRIGGFYANWKGVKVSYENDGHPFGLFNFGDNGDSYRTSSVSLGYKDLTVNLNLYTGYRRFEPDEIVQSRRGYPYGVVANSGADKYREGILTVGYKTLRLGWNSEGIRHAFQNQFAHKVVKPQTWFRFVPAPSRPVIGTRKGSSYHNW